MSLAEVDVRGPVGVDLRVLFEEKELWEEEGKEGVGAGLLVNLRVWVICLMVLKNCPALYRCSE